jgi:hypothetical protein
LRECFLIHEIGRIDGGRGFQTGENVFQIGRNTFYDQKNTIPMKILEFKRTGIGIIAEFRRILSGFPNQACKQHRRLLQCQAQQKLENAAIHFYCAYYAHLFVRESGLRCVLLPRLDSNFIGDTLQTAKLLLFFRLP